MTNTCDDMENPMVHQVTLKRPEDFAPGTRPTVSLHLLVKNGESCVGRLLRNVGPYIDEVVAIVNDTTDRTRAILEDYATYRGAGFRLEIIEVTAETNPELYLLDVPETYKIGDSLAGEVYTGPFTGKYVLADWAGIRNLGWNRATMEWRLFLDADDVVKDPETIPGICWDLGLKKLELACSKYIFQTASDGRSIADSFRERVAKNVPHIQWHGIVHEVLKGVTIMGHIVGNLVVTDQRDSLGAEIRIPGRCFKTLYRHARRCHWDERVTPRELIYLAVECQFSMPDLAAAALALYLARSTWPEEMGWACSLRGEIAEAAGDLAGASSWYEKSLQHYPGYKAAFRLCRPRFLQCQWQAVIDAYNKGISNKGVRQILDSGEVAEDMTKIFVIGALGELGRFPEARDLCEAAVQAFPHKPSLKIFLAQINAQIAAQQGSPHE